MLACDFETTVYEGQEFTEVWSAAYARLYSDKVVVHHTIQDFLDDLFAYRTNLVCWFHNQRFDGTFIVNHLLKNGWTWTDSKELGDKEFSTLITKQGRWYLIRIKSGGNVIEIRDSVKLMPFTLEQIGEAFNTEHRKLNMEYKGNRYAGCSITKEEMEYIINDVLVLKEALEYMINEGNKKLTIGSCAMHQYKREVGKNSFATRFPRQDEILLPECYGSVNADEYVRKSYKGGWCYLKKGKEGRRGRGKTFDVNSLYPSIMHSDSGNYYPIGNPHFWRGNIPEQARQNNHVYFVRFRCRFYLKEGYLPTIQIKGNSRYKSNVWLETSDVEYRGKRYRYIDGEDTSVVMTMTHKDFELFNKHYNVEDLEILDGCWYYSAKGLFDDYINYWMNRKENAKTRAERTLAKLFLNNLYGKFATNPDSSYKEPFLCADGSIDFKLHEAKEKEPGYIPIGTMVTSYARYFTITAAQKNYEQFVYADTDSLHLECAYNFMPEGIKIHAKHLLCWKNETVWSSGIFLRQKTYTEFVRIKDGEKVYPHWEITCAGMSDKAKANFLKMHPATDFKYGLRVRGNLEPVRIPGGVILRDSVFTLRKK